MDEALFTLVARLIRVEAELGEVAYERAVHDALVAVAAAVLHEAEAAAACINEGGTSKVVKFPMGRKGRPDVGQTD